MPNANSMAKDSYSPFYWMKALYTRNPDESLTSVNGPLSEKLKATGVWTFFRQSLKAHGYSTIVLNGHKHATSVYAYSGKIPGSGCLLKVFELQKESENQIRGIVIMEPVANLEDSLPTKELIDWFISFTLWNARLAFCQIPLSQGLNDQALRLARQITALFSKHLRNISQNDLWDSSGGSKYFTEKVLFFTSRNVLVEFVLPAFPCKSTSLNKVASEHPDKGEELALQNLHKFVQQVAEIYPPGAKIHVVSDGHVFSDCIGVDDNTVDWYGAELLALRNNLLDPAALPFHALPDILHPDTVPEGLKKNLLEQSIRRYLSTQIDTTSDFARILLQSVLGIDDATLRTQIKDDSPETLSLYRGFSRFMLDDLADQKTVEGLSKSQRKKLATKISFEMMKRNQAYSNLIETVFPHHIRLSIHAHPNCGPKFGIALLDRSRIQYFADLTGSATRNTDDLLHIPTPWHNTVCQFNGNDQFVMVKAKAVRDAEKSGEFKATWITPGIGEGGYFLIQRVTKMKDVPATRLERCSDKRGSVPVGSTHGNKIARIVHSNVDVIPLAGFHERVMRVKGFANGWLRRCLFRSNQGFATSIFTHSCEGEMENPRTEEVVCIS